MRQVNPTITLTAVAVGISTVVGLYFYQRRRRNSIPTEWKPVGKVKSLFIYPLKSGHRTEIKSADCTPIGVQTQHLKDRVLVVYKEADKEQRTARTFPKLVLVEVTADQNNYYLNAPGMPTLKVPIIKLETTDNVTGWLNEKMFTIDCGNEAARWISEYVQGAGTGYRLGYHDAEPTHYRKIEKLDTKGVYRKTYPGLISEGMGLYSDLASYLIVNQASVDEAASRIEDEDITVHYYRPNIIVDGPNLKPFEEDNWKWVKIGDAVFMTMKPCARCVLTTVNPELGVMTKSNEPLKTLKTYRKVKDIVKVSLEGESPIMGNYLCLKRAGKINANDIVYVGK